MTLRADAGAPPNNQRNPFAMHPSKALPPTSRPFPVASDAVGAIVDNPRSAVAICVVLVAAIALADYATGYAARLAVLYLLPVSIATWSAGRTAGALIATLATLAWMLMFRSSHPYALALYYYWEVLVLFCTLQIFAFILAQLRRALRNADERFVTVLEELDAAVYVSDVDNGEILYANRRFGEYFGARADAHDAREFEAALTAAANSPGANAPAPAAPLALEHEFRDPASGRWFLVHARTISWVDARRVSLKVLADITESKRAEQARRLQMEKLQLSSKLITIGEMASGLAHELNQPLTAIASYNQSCLRLLRAGKHDPAELLGVMEKCSAQAVRAGGIINRMREFVRKREPVRSEHQLNAIVTEAVQMIAIDAEKKGVEISLNLAPALPPLQIDAIMIGQVLLNLLRNAIEAMQQLAPASRKLDVSTRRNADAAQQVSLRDSGPGIAPEVAAHLYTPFFSTKPDGMGIGLNISRSIVEFHGGKLWHEAGAQGGCVFHFTLPTQPT